MCIRDRCKENSVVTTGYDDILSVNLASNMLDGKGAVWEDGNALQNFLKGKMCIRDRPSIVMRLILF